MKILVLLSSYNGEKYIYEQITTILNQNDVDVHLLIRDDGSRDTTCKIIKGILDERIELIEANNIGCINSFSELINLAAKRINLYDYFAFADQDDIWHPDKLSIAVSQLDKVKNLSVPMMYACNMNVVNENNEFIALLHPFKLIPQKGQLLFNGRFAGCSIVFNRVALTQYAVNPPQSIVYHDYWLTLICAFLGEIIYDKSAYINYRQHSNNVLGAHRFLESKLKKIYTRLKHILIQKKRQEIIKKYNILRIPFLIIYLHLI